MGFCLFDAVKPDPDKRREAGVTAWADDYYNKRYGMRIVSLIPAPGNHFVLREAIGADQRRDPRYGQHVDTERSEDPLLAGEE